MNSDLVLRHHDPKEIVISNSENVPLSVKGNPKVTDFVASQWKYNSIRRKIAVKQLNSQLKDAVITANGYLVQKLPKGSQAYKDVFNDIDKKVQQYCDYWNVDRRKVLAKAPVFEQLRAYAYPQVAQEYGKNFGMILLILVGFFVSAIFVAGWEAIHYHAFAVLAHWRWSWPSS